MVSAIERASEKPVEALAASSEATRLVREHGVIDHLSSIRMAHIDNLLAHGEQEAARRAIAAAREVLNAHLASIDDETLRRSFLAAVPENARLLELSALLLPA